MKKTILMIIFLLLFTPSHAGVLYSNSGDNVIDWTETYKTLIASMTTDGSKIQLSASKVIPGVADGKYRYDGAGATDWCDIESTFKYIGRSGTPRMYIMIRYYTAAVTDYTQNFIYILDGTSRFFYTSNTNGIILNTAFILTANDIVKIRVWGTNPINIQVFINDVKKFDQSTTADLNATGSIGYGVYNDVNNTAYYYEIDDLLVEDYVLPTVYAPKRIFIYNNRRHIMKR